MKFSNRNILYNAVLALLSCSIPTAIGSAYNRLIHGANRVQTLLCESKSRCDCCEFVYVESTKGGYCRSVTIPELLLVGTPRFVCAVLNTLKASWACHHSINLENQS